VKFTQEIKGMRKLTEMIIKQTVLSGRGLMGCDVIRYKRFRTPCCLHLQGEDGGNKIRRNASTYYGIIGRHKTLSPESPPP